MAFTARDAIEVARDQHPAFTEERHPSRLLLRALTSYVRELTSKLIDVAREEITEEEVVQLPLADFEAGYVLPAAMRIHTQGDVVYLNGEKDVFEVIAWEQRHGSRPRYAGWVLEGTLYLADTPAFWSGIDHLVIRYVPEVAAVTSSAATVNLPASAVGTCAAALARFMAGRSRPDDGVDRAWFLAQAQQAEREFLDQLGKKQGPRWSVVEDVY